LQSFYALAALTIALSIPSIASASILYSSMPDNDLTAADLVFDSSSGFFHLDSYALIDRITMALWVNPGNP
jgi:hypothetical protein